jgi:hypothetical protein
VKPGDLVRVVAVSPRLPDDPETKLVFARCVGHVFPVVEVTAHGHIELEVGDVMGVPTSLHSIWIEPECLEIVQARSAP